MWLKLFIMTALAIGITIAGTMYVLGQTHSVQTQTSNKKWIDPDLPVDKGVAYFAGWCFWCIESIMDAQDGVITAISGYAGWTSKDPNYKQVASGKTDFREAVKVEYNKNAISFEELTEIFFRQIDPTDPGGQFADRGFHYTTAIYYVNEDEKKSAESIIQTLEDSKKFDKPIVTKVVPYTNFYRAEEEHQDFAQKQSAYYKRYKKWSGRTDYIEKTWEDDTVFWIKNLTKLQYEVTQNDGTEPPFANEYWDNKEAGIYVDVVDGTPLFSSLDKFVSWSGWPSFTRPIDEALLEEKQDNSLILPRTEVRSKNADSHLGHVFTDGPKDEGGLRYCINSAALRFVPVADLDRLGYKKYLELFQ